MCQFGLTKIFLRKQMIQSLDALRELKLQDMDKAAVLIQSVYRMYDCKRGFRAVQDGFARSQAAWRAIYYRREWVRHRNAVACIQHCVRGWLAQRYRRRLLKAVCTIQAFVRKYKLRGQWLRLRRGLRTFHRQV